MSNSAENDHTSWQSRRADKQSHVSEAVDNHRRGKPSWWLARNADRRGRLDGDLEEIPRAVTMSY
jgi:hypothetical protein